MNHQMIRCDGTSGRYVAQCQCGQEFTSEWLSDLLYSFNTHRRAGNKIEADNVISIFTRKPLLV